jgi:hypothetical protein
LQAGEKEFIISPSYAALFAQMNSGKQINEHKFWSYKKPFDWMLDDQFLNLQVIELLKLMFKLG